VDFPAPAARLGMALGASREEGDLKDIAPFVTYARDWPSHGAREGGLKTCPRSKKVAQRSSQAPEIIQARELVRDAQNAWVS
jgi:hypothetical protein